MSIIIAASINNTVYMASDGRLMDERDGSIRLEAMNKTIKLSENVLIGFAGYSGRCFQIMEKLMRMDVSNIDIVSQEINDLFERDFSRREIANFLVAGRKENGLPGICAIGTATQGEILKYGKNSYYVIYPEDIPDIDYFMALHTQYPDLAIPELIEHTVQCVIRLSPSVNTRCFYQELQL